MDKTILEVVHESASDLHKSDVMNDITMREFDALCLPKIKQLTANQIKRLRVKNKASQGCIIWKQIASQVPPSFGIIRKSNNPKLLAEMIVLKLLGI